MAPHSRSGSSSSRCPAAFSRSTAMRPSGRGGGHMAVRYGFLSTHPPTRCGLATFNSALVAHLTAGAASGGVVRVTAAGEDQHPGPDVVHTWSAGTPAGWPGGAAALNTFDVAIVQHEYGIYPGTDGGDILPLLRRLIVPRVVVLHTGLSRPVPGPAGA